MALRGSDSGLWVAIGGIGAILFGVALIPLRSITTASNLAFVFLIFTIVVAEMGGRTAGLTTAVVSALSLNFFLMQPYLTLVIQKSDDIVAFAALAVCGLIAAAFGRRRARSSELVIGVRHDLAAVERTVEALAKGEPVDAVLEDLRGSFGLGGLVLRHGDERLVAATPREYAGRPAPVLELEPRTLLATDARWHRIGRRGFRLPDGGGRVRIGPDGESFQLDLWEGDPDGLAIDDCRALALAAATLGLALPRRATHGAPDRVA
jgi:hypothetical protein